MLHSKRQFTALHLAAYRVIQRLHRYYTDTDTTQFYTVQHSTTQYYTVLHSKRQFTALHLAAYRVIQTLRFYTVRGSLQLSTWPPIG